MVASINRFEPGARIATEPAGDSRLRQALLQIRNLGPRHGLAAGHRLPNMQFTSAGEVSTVKSPVGPVNSCCECRPCSQSVQVGPGRYAKTKIFHYRMCLAPQLIRCRVTVARIARDSFVSRSFVKRLTLPATISSSSLPSANVLNGRMREECLHQTYAPVCKECTIANVINHWRRTGMFTGAWAARFT